MIAADQSLHRVDEDWADPPDAVSADRLDAYRRLLKDVGCRRGFCAYPGRPGVYFISAARGVVAGSTTQGYYYFEGVPPLLVTNTAAYTPKPDEYSYEVFRLIEGHWYIFYEVD